MWHVQGQVSEKERLLPVATEGTPQIYIYSIHTAATVIGIASTYAASDIQVAPCMLTSGIINLIKSYNASSLAEIL